MSRPTGVYNRLVILSFHGGMFYAAAPPFWPYCQHTVCIFQTKALNRFANDIINPLNIFITPHLALRPRAFINASPINVTERRENTLVPCHNRRLAFPKLAEVYPYKVGLCRYIVILVSPLEVLKNYFRGSNRIWSL